MSIEVKRLVLGPIRTNCYIVYNSETFEAVVIDPADESYVIENKLAENKLLLKGILLTHGHFDHIGAAGPLKKRFGIDIYALKEEREILTTDKNLGSMINRPITLEADKYVSDGDNIELIGRSFKVIHTLGHTIGSCCYYIEEEKMLFSGDTLFYHSHGRTDFPTGSQSGIIQSIKDRLLILDKDTVVFPGHEDETTIGNERQLYDFT